jgi:hypothetical protein
MLDCPISHIDSDSRDDINQMRPTNPPILARAIAPNDSVFGRPIICHKPGLHGNGDHAVFGKTAHAKLIRRNEEESFLKTERSN